jgi:hypothetical protein
VSSTRDALLHHEQSGTQALCLEERFTETVAGQNQRVELVDAICETPSPSGAIERLTDSDLARSGFDKEQFDARRATPHGTGCWSGQERETDDEALVGADQQHADRIAEKSEEVRFEVIAERQCFEQGGASTRA